LNAKHESLLQRGSESGRFVMLVEASGSVPIDIDMAADRSVDAAVSKGWSAYGNQGHNEATERYIPAVGLP
jgi:hypothetical protein